LAGESRGGLGVQGGAQVLTEIRLIVTTLEG